MTQLTLWQERVDGIIYPVPEQHEGRIYTHAITDNGRDVTMHYRCIGKLNSGVVCWEYRPDYRDYWTEVRSWDVVRNLNAGNHPRAHINRIPQPEWKYDSEVQS